MEYVASPHKKIQDLRSFTVQIRHIKTHAIVGTGFVVSPEGLIATCPHVVVAAGVNPRLGKRIPSHWKLIRESFFTSPDAIIEDATAEIPVYFQWAHDPQQRSQKAIVIGYFPDYEDDVVLLKLRVDTLPEGIGIADVGMAEDSVGYAVQHQFRSLGYRRLGDYLGLPADGTILHFGGQPPGRALQADPLVLDSKHIDSGMSGAAVLDAVRDKVVGIISETSDIRAGTDRDTSFAVDYKVVLRLPPMDAALSGILLSQGTPESARSAATEIPGVKPVAIQPEPTTQPGIDLDHSPTPLQEWVGREPFLENLNQDWQDPKCLITGLIGFGGEGKTSLARRWVEHVLHSELSQPQGVFWWGFYERRSVDEFFEALLRYLSPQSDPVQFPSSSSKIKEINAVFKGKAYLFILDGLEVLQRQERDDYGLLTSIDLKSWLRDFAEGGHHSFCLITSRAPMLDLIDFTTYTHRDVERLSDAEGVQLLRNLGVQGDEPDLLQVVQQWDGYALVLSLLGSYLVDHHNGAVSQLPDDLAPTIGEPKYDRVSRVLRRYNEHLTVEQWEFLEVFSAFRLPVPESALEQVFGLPPTPLTQGGFIDSIRRLLALPWFREERGERVSSANTRTRAPIDDLVAYRILRHNPQKHTYTTHPLIRSHYLQRLNANPDRAKAIHQQIAEYYLAYAGETPENPTLDDLAPLIEAVHHFCQTGDYVKAAAIRWDRIYQGDRRVLIYQLGAYDTDLALLQEFFPNGDTTHDPQVSNPAEQSSILSSIGTAMMNLGRLREAPPFYERALAGYISGEDWGNVSTIYVNVADLYAYLGNLTAGADAVQSALMYARRTEVLRYEYAALARQGRVDHLIGRLVSAKAAFRQAETILRQQEPGKNYLYSGVGIYHADHLRRVGESDYARKVMEANRETSQRNAWLDDLSQSHRALGDLDADAEQHDRARQHYDVALQIARGISIQTVLIEALLARGRWAARQGDVPASRGDLEEALHHAVSGGYRIHEADIRVGLAWLHLNAGNLATARQEAERTKRMSEEMGYYWGQVDVEEVFGRLQSRG